MMRKINIDSGWLGLESAISSREDVSSSLGPRVRLQSLREAVEHTSIPPERRIGLHEHGAAAHIATRLPQSYCQELYTQGSRGVLLHSETILEDQALHGLRQVMRGSQPMPSLRSTLPQFEHHRQRGGVR